MAYFLCAIIYYLLLYIPNCAKPSKVVTTTNTTPNDKQSQLSVQINQENKSQPNKPSRLYFLDNLTCSNASYHRFISGRSMA